MQQMTQKKQRAKRRIKKFDFTGEDSAVALVGPAVGGPANGVPTILFKGADQFSEDFQQSIAKMKIKMSSEEFMAKFFNEFMNKPQDLAKAMNASEDLNEDIARDAIESNLQNLALLKALHEADNKLEILESLTEEDYLAMLQDQEILEAALDSIEKNSLQDNPEDTRSSLMVTPQGNDTSRIACEVISEEVSKASVNIENLEKHMTQEVNPEVMTQEVTVEMVEKSAFESVQKALEEQQAQLAKALETIKQFEEEKRQAIIKAKTDKVHAIIKDEKHRDIITKASLSLESEDDFSAFMAAMQAMMQSVETSQMFMEKGASVDTEAESVQQESAVARVLKARQAKK